LLALAMTAPGRALVTEFAPLYLLFAAPFAIACLASKSGHSERGATARAMAGALLSAPIVIALVLIWPVGVMGIVNASSAGAMVHEIGGALSAASHLPATFAWVWLTTIIGLSMIAALAWCWHHADLSLDASS